MCAHSPESQLSPGLHHQSREGALPLCSAQTSPPEHCIQVWGPQHRKDVDLLERVWKLLLPAPGSSPSSSSVLLPSAPTVGFTHFKICFCRGATDFTERLSFRFPPLQLPNTKTSPPTRGQGAHHQPWAGWRRGSPPGAGGPCCPATALPRRPHRPLAAGPCAPHLRPPACAEAAVSCLQGGTEALGPWDWWQQWGQQLLRAARRQDSPPPNSWGSPAHLELPPLPQRPARPQS